MNFNALIFSALVLVHEHPDLCVSYSGPPFCNRTFLPAVRLWACALRIMRFPQDPDLFHKQHMGLGVVHSHLLGRPCNEHQTHANHGCRDGTQEIMQAEARQAYVHRECTNRREIYIQYTSSSSSTYCEKKKSSLLAPFSRSTYCANSGQGSRVYVSATHSLSEKHMPNHTQNIWGPCGVQVESDSTV